MKILAMKFGGTSVGSAEAITQVAGIICRASKDTAESVVVIVSAISGVTDRLQEGVLTAAAGDTARYPAVAQHILDQHEAAARILLHADRYDTVMDQVQQYLNEYVRFCDSVRVLGDRKSTRLNSSHQLISYAVFCL